MTAPLAAASCRASLCPGPFPLLSLFMATVSNPAQPGLAEIWLELRALRLELAELRGALARPPQADGFELPARTPAVDSPEPFTRQPSAATLLVRRNGERLQQEVRRRLATAAVQGDDGSQQNLDTEVDLLIDRLHDLAEASGDGP